MPPRRIAPALIWTCPPAPRSFRGRAAELATLERFVRASHPSVLALIGAGGSGKTTLAAALVRRLRTFFAGRVAWLRIGAWDEVTVAKMMAMQLGVSTRDPLAALRAALTAAGPALIVLDNHESDRTTARVLRGLEGTPVTWVLTARRCLLGGVTPFPVIAPLVALRRDPFPAVAKLTRLLRWHAVALDIADALVATRRTSVDDLHRRLVARGVGRIEPVEHEDDVPEVRGVVAEALRHLPAPSKRLLAILATMGGDHLGEDGLAAIARSPASAVALAPLVSCRLVQEPHPGRFTLHATVRHALRASSRFDPDRLALRLLGWLERDPGRLRTEQTHLYALMDWAQERRELGLILRVQDLGEQLEASVRDPGPGRPIGRSRRREGAKNER